MGRITDQAKSEIKQLPLMIGKVLGGILAVISFTVAVVILTRKADLSLVDILPSALLGCLGIIVFVLSSRLLARRYPENSAQKVDIEIKNRTNMLSWVILLLFAAVLLLMVYLYGKFI